MTKLYVAGPMQGYPQFNFPAFDAAASVLRAEGFEVISPSELDDPKTRADALASPDGLFRNGKQSGQSWGDFLARDVKIVADQIDGIALLPGWERSKGARLEAFVGLASDKKFFMYYPDTETVSAVSKALVQEIIRGNMP